MSILDSSSASENRFIDPNHHQIRLTSLIEEIKVKQLKISTSLRVTYALTSLFLKIAKINMIRNFELLLFI